MKKSDIIKPIQFASVINVKPQYIYSLIREGKLTSHECICGTKFLVKAEIVTSDWFTKQPAERQALFTNSK